jgi:6-phosphogluconolactonase
LSVPGATPRARPATRGADEPIVEVHDDAEATSRAAAARIAAALSDALAGRGRADWTTTGGSTPIPIYRHLAASPCREGLPWDRVHVWWGDDRFVPRDHPLSNVRPLDEVRRATLGASGDRGPSGDGGPPGVLHPIATDDAIRDGTGAAGAAAAYEAELRAAGLPLGSSGFPCFDVVLAGVGPDGHLFSIFPDSTLFEAPEWVSAVPAPEHVEPHVERVSLSPAIVEAARLALVVIHGAAKAEVVARVLGPRRDPRRWPAQLARRPGAVWLLDRAAASQLEDRT